MINNRLDLIKNISLEGLKKISTYIELFIALDNELVKLGDDQHGHRNLVIARTNIEQALMNTLKVIAIQHEIKEE